MLFLRRSTKAKRATTSTAPRIAGTSHTGAFPPASGSGDGGLGGLGPIELLQMSSASHPRPELQPASMQHGCPSPPQGLHFLSELQVKLLLQPSSMQQTSPSSPQGKQAIPFLGTSSLISLFYENSNVYHRPRRGCNFCRIAI